MRRYIFILFFSSTKIRVHSQENNIYQTNLLADQNLNAIMNLSSYSVGGIGFDNRYQGIKGSPGLFDMLLHSFLKVKGQDNYLQFAADIDHVGKKLCLFIQIPEN